jgi:hypothetical protein
METANLASLTGRREPILTGGGVRGASHFLNMGGTPMPLGSGGLVWHGRPAREFAKT